MERIQIVAKMLRAKRKVAIAHYHYLNTPREYTSGQKLFMREAHFLTTVGVDGGVTMSDVAVRLEVTQGAATQLATRLEKKGLILRIKDSQDQRRTMVSLTEQGALVVQSHILYDQKSFVDISEKLSMFSDEELLLCIKYEKELEKLFVSLK